MSTVTAPTPVGALVAPDPLDPPVPLAPRPPRDRPTPPDPLDVSDPHDPHDLRTPGSEAWLTAAVRPAGTFGRHDVGRLRTLLDALSACASIVVLDLQSARLRSPRAVAVIDDAARRLAGAGGCLLCVNADPETRTHLAGCRAVVIDHR